jgi:hypothetical protein
VKHKSKKISVIRMFSYHGAEQLNAYSVLTGQNGALNDQKGIPLKQNPPSTLSEDIEERHTEVNFSPRDQQNRNPFIQRTEVQKNCIKGISHLKDQLVEEPWLLFQTAAVSGQVKDPLISSMVIVPESPSWEKITTKILISSSLCNMRRIAVLENGTLVELILESLNNSVLFNNIYLGVIKEMMPQTGGALVDIGLTEPVFMLMAGNREPFVYATKKAIMNKSEHETNVNYWARVSVGDRIIVQVIKPEEGESSSSSTKSVKLTPYPEVESRFWVSTK